MRLGAAFAVAALLAVEAPRVARGQSTIEGGRGTLLVPDADTVPPTQFTTSLSAGWVQTGREPFQLSPAAVTFGFTNRLDVGFALRSWSPDDPEGRGARFDPLLSLKVRLLTESSRRPALALRLGADHAFEGWDLSPSLVAHKDWGPLLVTGDVGYRRPLHRDPADPRGPFFGAGAGWWVTPRLGLYLHALGQGGSRSSLSVMPGIAWSLLGPDPLEARRAALRLKAREAIQALEAELGTRVDLTPSPGGAAHGAPDATIPGRVAVLGQPGRVSFFVTGGPTFGAGPEWRVVAGIQISTFDEFLQDSDGDGIPDRIDQCPFEPEDWDGYDDGDGCPDGGVDVLRKRTRERLAAEESAAKPTTPTPRFRLRIAPGEVPIPGASRRETAPMYQPLDAPPPPPAAPATPPPPPAAPRTPAGPTGSSRPGRRPAPAPAHVRLDELLSTLESDAAPGRACPRDPLGAVALEPARMSAAPRAHRGPFPGVGEVP